MPRFLRATIMPIALALALVACASPQPIPSGARQTQAPSQAAAQTAPSPSPAPIADEPDTDTRDLSERVTEAIRQYCPEGTDIIETVSAGTGKSFEETVAAWAKLMPGKSVYMALGTIVHEETHRLQSLNFASHYVDGELYDMKDAIAGLFSSDPEKSLPKSELMAELIPQGLRTVRYEKYIAQGVENGANSDGILGLLKEFEAYCNGALATYEVYAQLSERPVRKAEYMDYYNKLNNDGEAFFEFTFFIERYMMYVRDNNPALHETLMKRQGIWEAFRYNYEKFSVLAEESIPARNGELLRRLQDAGRNAWFTGQPYARQMLHIDNEARGTDNDVTAVIAEIKKPEYTEFLKTLLDAAESPE